FQELAHREAAQRSPGARRRPLCIAKRLRKPRGGMAAKRSHASMYARLRVTTASQTMPTLQSWSPALSTDPASGLEPRAAQWPPGKLDKAASAARPRDHKRNIASNV